MPTLTEIADAFESPDVRKQIVGAVIQTSTEIRSEGAGVPKHQIRLRWARKVMLSPRQMSERMIGALLADSTVNAELPTISDSAIQGAVGSLILTFANTALPEATDAV